MRVTRSRELVAEGYRRSVVARVAQIGRQAIYRTPGPRARPPSGAGPPTGASLPRASGSKPTGCTALVSCETPRFAGQGSQPASGLGVLARVRDQSTKTITTMTMTATTTAMPILRGVMWRLRKGRNTGRAPKGARAAPTLPGLAGPSSRAAFRSDARVWRAAHWARGCARGAGPPPALGRPLRRAWSSPRSMSPRRKPSPA
jgi:hypothetical protein